MKIVNIERKETLPTNIQEALEMMRFGCPFLHGDNGVVGEFDVPYFERRMLKAADLLEAHIKKYEKAAESLHDLFID